MLLRGELQLDAKKKFKSFYKYRKPSTSKYCILPSYCLLALLAFVRACLVVRTCDIDRWQSRVTVMFFGVLFYF